MRGVAIAIRPKVCLQIERDAEVGRPVSQRRRALRVPVTLFVPIGEATQGDPASWIPFAPQMRQSPAVADPLRSVTPPLELAGLAIADESPAPSEKPGRVGSSSALICWACGWATSPNETAMKGNKRFTGILRVMRLGRRDRGRGGLTACEVWQT